MATRAALSRLSSADDSVSAADVVRHDDARLSDDRDPTAHASTHASGGTDPVSPASIGASATSHDHAATYQPLDSDLTAIAGLAPSNDDVVQRKAGAWTNRTMAQLLSDLGAVPTSRALTASTGLTGGGTLAADRSFAVSYGSSSGTAVQGNDARVTADQAAGTASIRTLGTGASQAAPGSHTHAVLDARTVPATSRTTTNPGPGGAATGLVTGAGNTSYVLTEIRPPLVNTRYLRLRYWNGRTFDGAGGEVAVGNTVTLRASVLYPAGVWRQVSSSTAWASGTTYNAGDMVTSGGKTWVAYGPPITVGVAPTEGTQWTEAKRYAVTFPGQDANRRVAVAGGATVDSDTVDLTSSNTFTVMRPYLAVTTTYETGNAANVWMPGDVLGVGDFGVNYATTGAVPTPGSGSDPVDSGFSTQTSLGAGSGVAMPSVVFALVDPVTAPPVVGFLGDSLVLGTGDAFIGLYGWASRAAESFVMLRSAQGGGQAAHFLNGHAYRDVLLAGCDAVVVGFGGNELLNSQALATIQASFLTAWRTVRALGPRVWATTTTPVTTSTDSWATVANQTAANASFGTSGTTYANLVKWLRDGAPFSANGQSYRAGHPAHPLAGVLDVVAPVVDPASPWKWKAPGYTTDGAHTAALAANVIAAYLRPWMPTVAYGADRRPLPLESVHHVSAWTIQPDAATGSLPALTSGTVYVAKLRWPGGTVYQLHAWVVAAGATLTSGQNLMGVYTPDGALLGVTATQHTAWTSTGEKVAALTTPAWAPAGELLVAWLSVGTTRPVFAATPTSTAAPGLANVNLPVQILRAATAATGQTSLPNPMTMTLTGITQVPWGAAS